MAIARTEMPPMSAPIAHPAAGPAPLAPTSGEIRPNPDRATMAGSVSPAAAKAKGGIPWNDSPKMPAQLTPPPSFQLPPNPLAGAAPTTASPQSTGKPMPAAGLAGTPPVGSASLAPAASPAPAANGENICPSCGKVNSVAFAFCGSCGTRLGQSFSGGAAALNAPRTMFMSGPAPVPAVSARGRLVLIRPDGTEGGAHQLNDGENLVGRGQGPLFDSDAYLSPRHGEFTVGASSITVRDLRSLNGVFLKITQEEPLESGDVFRIGQELLRFEVISAPQPLEDGTEVMGTPNPGFWGRLSVVVGRDVDGSAFPLFGDAIVLGRERGDILFPEDGYVSGAHARISLRDGQVFLADLGSSNGSFLRIRGERAISPGSFVLMGQQLFRVELS
jgi:pSer/pThr/pTyr-binding forkhead associated (FHA) protein